MYLLIIQCFESVFVQVYFYYICILLKRDTKFKKTLIPASGDLPTEWLDFFTYEFRILIHVHQT